MSIFADWATVMWSAHRLIACVLRYSQACHLHSQVLFCLSFNHLFLCRFIATAPWCTRTPLHQFSQLCDFTALNYLSHNSKILWEASSEIVYFTNAVLRYVIESIEGSTLGNDLTLYLGEYLELFFWSILWAVLGSIWRGKTGYIQCTTMELSSHV